MRVTRKRKQAESIRHRAAAALRDMYHNATPIYPVELHGRTQGFFQDWFYQQAEQEVDYIGDGGAYGGDYHKTLAAPCNGGKFTSERARRYYVAKGLRAMHEERAGCGMRTGMQRNSSMWECISDYGKLHTHGRGGRTLAPDQLVARRGGSGFSIRSDYFEEQPMRKVVEGIAIIEAFNRYVGSWCKGVPEMWEEHIAYEDAEKRAEAAEVSKNEAAERLERGFWACRGVVTA